MPLISENDAIQALQPYLPTIGGCINLAWDDYQNYPESLKINHSSTTRANIVNDNMVQRCISSIVYGKLVKHFEWGRQHIFVFEKRISLRFKKLNQMLMPSNILTKQASSLNCQHSIPGIEAATHLVAGYRLNNMETEIQDIHIVCPNNKRTYWELRLDGYIESAYSNIFDLFSEHDNSYENQLGSEFTKKNTEQDEVLGYESKDKS
ncbi:MAG: hypothetical protein ACXW04_11815 [Methylobacter sp.]